MRTFFMGAILHACLTWIQAHRRAAAAGACGLLLFAGGFACGARLHPRTVTTTVASRERDEAFDESKGLDLRKVQTKVEKPTRTTKTRIIYRDGPIRERVVTRVDEGGSTTRTDTQEKVHDDLRLKESEKDVQRSTVVVSPEGRWGVRLLAGVDTRGGLVSGAAADYRILGPLTLGAWVSFPVAGAPAPITVGFSAGLRL